MLLTELSGGNRPSGIYKMNRRRKNAVKKKILASAALLVALSASTGAVQAANILQTVGRHPVSRPLKSVNDLRAMMQEMGNDIKDGMRRAGNVDLFPLMQAHIEQNPQQISIVEYQPGQHIDWMLFRRYGQGRVKVAKDVTWGGKSSLSVFEFSIDKNGRRYTFAVPMQCGNLALKETAPAPVVQQQQIQQVQVPVEVIKYVDRPVQVPVQVNVPGPTVYVPKEVIKYVDRPVQVPVQVIKQVQVPGPTVYVPKEVIRQVRVPVNVPGPTVYVPKEVVKYVDRVKEVQVPGPERIVRVAGPTRTVVKKIRVQGPTRTVYVDKPVIKEVVKVKEVQTAATCCESPFHFVADGGYLRQSEDAEYGIGRLGVEYVLNRQFSFLALAGGAAKVNGDAGADAFLLDFLVQYNFFQCSTNGATWSPFFMGLGIGAWMTNGEDDVPSEDSQADFIAELGLRLFGNPTTTSVAIFLEGRVATDEIDELDEYGRIGGGLRFRF
jgi:hypothetical protein